MQEKAVANGAEPDPPLALFETLETFASRPETAHQSSDSYDEGGVPCRFRNKELI